MYIFTYVCMYQFPDVCMNADSMGEVFWYFYNIVIRKNEENASLSKTENLSRLFHKCNFKKPCPPLPFFVCTYVHTYVCTYIFTPFFIIKTFNTIDNNE